jgi:protein-S-isoprenylcysteine O-methyltransferase Ste14
LILTSGRSDSQVENRLLQVVSPFNLRTALLVSRLKPNLKYLAANLAVLWVAWLFYRTNHYYVQFLSDRTQMVLLWLAAIYSVAATAFYLVTKNPQPTHAYVGLRATWKCLRNAASYVRAFPDAADSNDLCFSEQERVSLLFLLLKFFYLPMMIEFLLANWDLLAGLWWSYSGVMSLPRLEAFNNFVFPCLINVFFIIECALYAFSYAFESVRLKNVVRSIDPTVLGWAVALACYPPFNGFVNNYVSWFTSDDPSFPQLWLTTVARCAVLVCFGIYLWGATSLGTKCSNLTHRGIVTTGAFRWVRHPAYAAKNLAWWIALLPVLSLPAVLSMTFWSFLYYLRAITEERHLGKDPVYLEYCRTVRYRFIPGIW